MLALDNMVKHIRSNKAKANKKEDTRVTSRKKNGGDSNNDGSEPDDVLFRQFLAKIFPSNFANEQVKKAKNKKRVRKDKTRISIKSQKKQESSDASSESSYEENNSDNNSSSSESSSDEENMTIFRITPNGKMKKVNHNKSKTLTNKTNKTKNKEDKETISDNEQDSDNEESTDEDYEPTDKKSLSDTESESTEDLECEDDTLVELFGGKDYNPAEDSEYSSEEEDNNDKSDSGNTIESPVVIDKNKKKNKKSNIPNKVNMPELELDDFEVGLQKKLEIMPNEFQLQCKKLWFSFKEKLEKERKQFEATSKKREKKSRKNNLSKFRKLLKEGDVMNDLKYFNRVMTMDEQAKALQEMEQVKIHTYSDKPYRLRLLEAQIPAQIKAIALKKINALRYTSPGDGEYNKLKKWVDAFLQIPFGKHSQLNLNLTDGQAKCHDFMDNAKTILDKAVYGLDDAKLQIIQMLGQWISNPQAIGSAIAIHGPMGTGKTTLVKEGISQILGREFIFIALGGATDSSFLEGHSYTYEGSTWGKIVDSLMQCKTMNPIIYFDELDKVSDTPRGEEIIGILTHLTDSSQNDKFHDKYFNEIDFDLSKCLFIFSYNDPERVNPILRDRMYTIKTNGYSSQQKVTIAEEHLLPKLMPQVGFIENEVSFPSETLSYITREYTCNEEKGVRTLKRRLEIICTKLNLYRLLKPGTEIFGQKIPESVEFPITVTPELVKDLLKKEEKDNRHWVMYS